MLTRVIFAIARTIDNFGALLITERTYRLVSCWPEDTWWTGRLGTGCAATHPRRSGRSPCTRNPNSCAHAISGLPLRAARSFPRRDGIARRAIVTEINGRASKKKKQDGIAYKYQARSQLPRVPADRPLEETPASVATRHAVVLPGGLVAADLAQRLPASVLLHFRRTCSQRKSTSWKT